MSKSTTAIARVASAPVSAPVSTFGDDGTKAAYYASMSRKDSRMYVAAVLPLLSAENVAEVLAIVAKWEAAETVDKAQSRLSRLVRKGKSVDKAFRLLGSMADVAADTANLSFVGHGRMGYTLMTEVPATEVRPSGRIKVVFTPDVTVVDGLPVPNEGHVAPVKAATDSETDSE